MERLRLMGVLLLGQSDQHLAVASARLGSVSSKQPIPPREIEAEVAVHFVRFNAVMDSVHVRRDKQPSQ